MVEPAIFEWILS